MLNDKYPYSDEYMVYDFQKHRYILTEKYVLDCLGINLRSKIGGNAASNPQAIINTILDIRLSHRIYTLIYAHNDKRLLEYIMAKSETARTVIQEAMGEQLLYILTEFRENKNWLSADAYNTLCTPIPALRGNALAYRQRLASNLFMVARVPSYKEGNY